MADVCNGPDPNRGSLANIASSVDMSCRVRADLPFGDDFDRVGILVGEVALNGDVTLLGWEVVGKGRHAALPDVEPEHRHR